jgi:hypothetical protein
VAKGIALHVGLNAVDPNHYEGWDGCLVGCENDARDMRAIAEREGYHATLLLTRQATHRGVTDAIAAAVRTLGESDIFLLTFSGHGGRVPDLSGAAREGAMDGRDETWVLYDRALGQDELFGLFVHLARGVRVFVLSDSCHNGSVLRPRLYADLHARFGDGGSDARLKAMPAETAKRTYLANQALYDEVLRSMHTAERRELRASVIVLAACQENQLSYDGARNGLFTERLLTVWSDGRFRGGYRRFHRAIQDAMPPWQSPSYETSGPDGARFARRQPFRI